MNKRMITVRDLSKAIKKKQILSDISFDIYRGDCLALIGPNGAGKTTLMNCLLGDHVLTSGQVTILDKPATDTGLRSHVGILFQENAAPQKLKVQEILDFERAIYDNPLSLTEIDDLLGFSSQQKAQFSNQLSGGQRRLLSFVQVLIGQPEVLILDEPTAGMDTSTRKRFWEIVNQLKEQGRTIIYSSHYIEEVEHTADRILVLHQGKILRDTTPYAMRQEEQEKYFTLPKVYSSAIFKIADIYDIEEKSDTLSFATRKVDEVWQELMRLGCQLSEIEMTNRSLLGQVFAMAASQKGEAHENL